jgi:hypothetical protein
MGQVWACRAQDNRTAVPITCLNYALASMAFHPSRLGLIGESKSGLCKTNKTEWAGQRASRGHALFVLAADNSNRDWLVVGMIAGRQWRNREESLLRTRGRRTGVFSLL